jgi:hypothetical protein
MISSGKINWSQLAADAERLGVRIEEEENYFRTENVRS